MWKCPVCEQSSESLLCCNCGFDGSQNYEMHPSFVKRIAVSSALSQLQKEHDIKSKYRLHCRKCGEQRFYLEPANGSVVCSACGSIETSNWEHMCKTSLSKKCTGLSIADNISNTIPPSKGSLDATLKSTVPQVPLEGSSILIAGNTSFNLRKLQKHTGIKAIATGVDHTVALLSDGTVVAVGEQRNNQCNVSWWNNIQAIAAGPFSTAGLRPNGTVLVTDPIIQRIVSSWTHISSIALGTRHAVGLRPDGTVIAAGDNRYGQCNVKGWTDIVSISAGCFHTIGVRKDGSVFATGANTTEQEEISKWSDIIAVSTAQGYTIGLRSNGTVVAAGSNKNGRCNVLGWKRIVAISASENSTIGLHADGTVISTDPTDAVYNWSQIYAIAAANNHIVCP